MKLSISRSLIASAVAIFAQEIQIVPKHTFKTVDSAIKKINDNVKKLESNKPLDFTKINSIRLFNVTESDGNINFELNDEALIDATKKLSKPLALITYQGLILGAAIFPSMHSISTELNALKRSWLSKKDDKEVEVTIKR